MHEQLGEVGAAIDIGSNSIHLLIARTRVAPDGATKLEPIDDRSELIGLGHSVDRLGRIPPESQAILMDTLDEYLSQARACGAAQITLLGTEPFRRAANAAEVAAEVRLTTGLMLHVIGEAVEARLTFIGATGGRAPAEPLVVVDIGGGSTEAGLFAPGAPFTVVALAVGSARLTNSIVTHDPPTPFELDRLHWAAQDAVRTLHAFSWPTGQRARAIFVGGTATNVARLGLLTRAALAEDRRTLGRMTAAQLVQHFGVRPQRARQLAAGVAIVDVLLEHLGLEEAQVSGASLRDGAIIAAARFGDAWPERIGALLAPADQPPGATAASH